MCGRFAQTQRAVNAAAVSLGATTKGSFSLPSNSSSADATNTTDASFESAGQGTTTDADTTASATNAEVSGESDSKTKSNFDNYNLSPGMDATVFWIPKGSAINDNKKKPMISMDRKVWGLIPRGGTPSSPLPTGMSHHFSNLMFNARSDTLHEKPTFSKLISQGQTCVVAIDGFFEWKEDPLPGLKGKKKQPYFVYRNHSSGKQEGVSSDSLPCLLLAGLWTSVPTGRTDDPKLDTFTLITTEVCDPLKWLHSRMPVCFWDVDHALQWLEQPNKSIFQLMDEGARQTKEGRFQWHAVTPEMSKTKYRSIDSIKALPKPKTVTSFFGPKKATHFAHEDNSKVLGNSKEQQQQDSKISASQVFNAKKEQKERQQQDSKVSASQVFHVKKEKVDERDTSAQESSPGMKRLGFTSSSQQPIKKMKSVTPTKKGSITSFFSPKPKNSN